MLVAIEVFDIFGDPECNDGALGSPLLTVV